MPKVFGWSSALAGLSLFVFSVVALSGPGRIDIVDGQARYEVARSLVDHGDHVIRDERIWFGVFPGRGGQLYTSYRFPHSVAGVVAILAADATGPLTEGRRHFFFTLIGAFACSVLAVAYAVLFRHLGHGPKESLLWAAAGIFCTPNWFYGTSTFDDILGSVTLILAVTLALMSRHRCPLTGAAAAGLMLGLAFNCKEPYGIFVLPVLAASYDRSLEFRQQLARFGLILAGLAIGIAAWKGYDLYKFPPGTTAGHAELLKKYAPNWPGHPVSALLALAFSPATGVFFYFPPLLIALYGIRAWYDTERWFCLAVLASTAIFVLFISSCS
jgi:4-amino-4-deoxy-L-arabinose transferase-like glycosyltransferase